MKKYMKIINCLLIIISICLASFIYKNKQLDLSTFTDCFYKLTNNLLTFNEDKTVSSSINYIHIKDDKYTNESFSIYPISNATVISIEDDSITLRLINGSVAIYDNLINVKVNKYDVVNKDNVVANFIDYFIFYVMKDGKIFNYEEIMENN